MRRPPPVPVAPPAPRWGLPDAGVGFVGAYVLSFLIVLVLLLAGGWEDFDDAPMWALTIAQLGLWTGFGGAALVAARVRGSGSLRADFGLEVRRLDVPIGLALGVAAQYVVNYAVSWPIVKLSGTSFDEYEEPARELADRAEASSWFGVALFVVVVVVAAPFFEELFWRGLVQRSLLRHLAAPVALVLTALLFGLSHGQPLQLAALAVFGVLLSVLAHRTGRLGLSIFTHAGFNATTVVALLVDRGR